MKHRSKIELSAPLPWALLLAYLAPRRIAAFEEIDLGAWRYTRRVDGGAVHASLSADGGHLRIETDAQMPGAEARARVTQLFALDEDHSAALRHLRKSATLKPRIARTPGLRPLGSWDRFELCVRTVLGQQVTVAAAGTLMSRLVQRCGSVTPARVVEADLSNMGMPGKRVDTLRTLAAAVLNGRLDLDANWPAINDALCELPGFGPWTRQYLAIRLGREPDAFPETDVGLIRAAGAESAKQLLLMAEDWRPYRSLAAIYLWAG